MAAPKAAIKAAPKAAKKAAIKAAMKALAKQIIVHRFILTKFICFVNQKNHNQQRRQNLFH